MSGDKLLDAMEFVSDELIVKTEKKAGISSRKQTLRKGKLAALIAAAVVAVCGTVAAAVGLLWNRPGVQTVENGLMATLNQGAAAMPEEAVSKVLASVVPERDYKAFLNFDSIGEWQEFFDLPFVASELTAPANSGAWTENERGEIVQRGPVDAIVSTVEENGSRSPSLMWTVLSIDRYRGSGENTELLWSGDLNIFASYREDAGAAFAMTMLGDLSGQSVEEYTAPSGIPYTTGRLESRDGIRLSLYYGYESVMYVLIVSAHSEEEADVIREDLKVFAGSLEIMYGVRN